MQNPRITPNLLRSQNVLTLWAGAPRVEENQSKAGLFWFWDTTSWGGKRFKKLPCTGWLFADVADVSDISDISDSPSVVSVPKDVRKTEHNSLAYRKMPV
jgi:hypothetical protein